MGGEAGLIGSAVLTTVTILLWATSLLPEYLTALLFLTAAMIVSLAPAEVVFSGFLSQAFWLVLSGFVLGAAIRKVGLADRIARVLLAQLSGSWPKMVAGVVALTYGLAFVMPSNMGRITLLMPIIMALADRTGLTAGTRGRIGLALAVGFGTFELSSSILPANVPNLVMAGAAQNAFGLHFAYLSYLLLHAPVLGLLKGMVLTALVCVMFPARPRMALAAEPRTRLSAAEKRLSVLLSVTLLLWMTDTLHGIEPAWVGLAAACVCLLPKVGFLESDDFGQVNMRTCIYVAGILGLAALVTRSGLGDLLGRALLAAVPLDPSKPALGFGELLGIATALNFVVTSTGLPALYTPIGRALADATGLPLATVLMVQVIGYATPLLPYQAAPVVVAMELGQVPARDGLRLCLALAGITLVLLAPIDYVWFRLLGWIG